MPRASMKAIQGLIVTTVLVASVASLKLDPKLLLDGTGLQEALEGSDQMVSTENATIASTRG